MKLDEKLIELVKRHDFLYNMESKNYKNLALKEEVWVRIGQQLGIQADACKRKWKGLRDTYKRIKQVKLPEGEGSSNRKPWKHEDRMRFLDDVQSSRISIIFKTEDTFYEDETDAAVNNLSQEGQTDQEQQHQQQDQQFDVLYTEEQEVSNEGDFEIENFDLNDYVKKIDSAAPTKPTTMTNTTSSNNSTHNTTTAQEQDMIRRKKYDKDALIQEACQEMTSLLQNAKKHFTPPSSNQVFFNSIALQVEEAQLPVLTQMRLQQRILEMVTLEIVNHQQSTMQQL